MLPFLEYSVSQVLAGNGHEELRERRIGIEVFQRPADYDTAEDAVVRVTANELRKRLAQYYLEAGQDSIRPSVCRRVLMRFLFGGSRNSIPRLSPSCLQVSPQLRPRFQNGC